MTAPGYVRLDDLTDDVSGKPARAVLAAMAAALRSGQSFLITSHVNPDGDALGSEAALAIGLQRLGKQAQVINHHGVPEKFRPLFPAGLLETASEDTLRLLGPFDWCVVLDTAEPGRLGAVEPVVFRPGQRRMCLDHHRTPPSVRYDQQLVLVRAPATASLVLRLLDCLDVDLSRDIAQSLWIGLSTDTGWFRFANTDPTALEDAARLVSCGIDTEALYERIYGSQTLSRARLVGEVLAALRSELDGRFVWSCVDQAMLRRATVAVAELDGLVETLKSISGARIVALVVEHEPGKHKVSLRGLGDACVEPIARGFSGGGHDKAAGFKYHGPMERLMTELRNAVRSALGA